MTNDKCPTHRVCGYKFTIQIQFKTLFIIYVKALTRLCFEMSEPCTNIVNIVYTNKHNAIFDKFAYRNNGYVRCQ